MDKVLPPAYERRFAQKKAFNTMGCAFPQVMLYKPFLRLRCGTKMPISRCETAPFAGGIGRKNASWYMIHKIILYMILCEFKFFGIRPES
jgi:hypothetical protein